MSIKKLFLDFAITFLIALATSALVTFLWNLIGHEKSSVNWQAAFSIAITVSAIITWVKRRISLYRSR
jgi:hypothetical protein